jgi:phage tail protein X
MTGMEGKPHQVYWGTHGCTRVKGHANPCLCWCGQALPTGHEYVFGLDQDTAIPDPIRKVWNGEGK